MSASESKLMALELKRELILQEFAVLRKKLLHAETDIAIAKCPYMLGQQVVFKNAIYYIACIAYTPRPPNFIIYVASSRGNHTRVTSLSQIRLFHSSTAPSLDQLREAGILLTHSKHLDFETSIDSEYFNKILATMDEGQRVADTASSARKATQWANEILAAQRLAQRIKLD